MKRNAILTATMTMMSFAVAGVFASDAATSATAGSNRYQPNGTAQATAHYSGDIGFARTSTQSGSVNLARGIAVGVDQSGLSLSVSNAVATQYGPAVATSFNLSIDRNGQVSRSGALTYADGPIHRSATAGGRVGTGRDGNAAIAFASGKTDRFGDVYARTDSEQGRPRPAVTRQLASSQKVYDRRYRK
jgi:hypothetical protein